MQLAEPKVLADPVTALSFRFQLVIKVSEDVRYLTSDPVTSGETQWPVRSCQNSMTRTTRKVKTVLQSEWYKVGRLIVMLNAWRSIQCRMD